MTIKELLEQLRSLGIASPAIPEKTLKRWAFTEKIISRPAPALQKGPGQTADWTEEALEEAAAVWAVRHNERGARVTAEMARIVKFWARNACSGWVTYKIPPLTRSPEGVMDLKHTDIELQFGPERLPKPDGSDAIDLFSGRDRKDKVAFLSHLVVKWIATVAKVQFTRQQGQLARDAGKHPRYLWPLEKSAIVVVHYHCSRIEGARYLDGKAAIGRRCQFDFLKIGGESNTGDEVFLSEYDADLKISIDPRIYLVNSIRFDAPSLDSLKMTVERCQESNGDMSAL